MMKKLYLFILIITSITYGQWERIFPNISAHQVKEIQIIDSLNWVITLYRIDYVTNIREHGAYFVRTTDGGKTWIEIFSNSESYSFNTNGHFINKQIGYITISADFSTNQAIYKTINGGSSWNYIPNPYKISKILFFDELNAVGYNDSTLLRTYDGAASWTKLNQPSLKNDKLYIFNNIIYSIHDSSLSISEDSARSWKTVGFNISLSDIYFDSKNVGYLLSEYAGVYKSIDGGTTWNQIKENERQLYSYSKILFSGQTGFIIYYTHPDLGKTASSHITNYQVTRDGGMFWEKHEMRYLSTGVRNGAIINDTTFILATRPVDFVITTDKGQTFTSINNFDFNSIFGWDNVLETYSIINDDKFYISTSSGLFVSTDGGNTINKVFDNNNFKSYVVCNDLNIIRASSKDVYPLYSLSFDTNKTWITPNTERFNFSIYSGGYFYSSVGDSLCQSTNGVDWQYLINCKIFNVKDSIIIAYSNQKFYKSTNWGKSFETIPYFHNEIPPREIVVTDANYFCKIDVYDNIVFTTDGGKSFYYIGFEGRIAYTFKHDNKPYFIMAEGVPNGMGIKSYLSDDVFKSWKDFGYSSRHVSNFKYTGNYLWGYGRDGSLVRLDLRKNVLGTDNRKDEIIYSFNLYQNYPNPFNPITNIEYKIPAASYVTLKVYNLLGEEVATLINEEKAAGSYTVLFEAKSLSTGIYFYVLRAGDYIDTKKMILLK